MEEQGGRQLAFNWNVRVLLGFASERIEEIPDEIHEKLAPEDFIKKADQKAYWSIPERLLDLRWAINRVGQVEKNREFFEKIVECECLLHEIVGMFARWIGTYENSYSKLKDIPQGEERENIEFLRELQKSGYIFEDAQIQGRNDVLDKLRDIAQYLIHDNNISDERTKNVRSAAKEYTDELKRLYGDGYYNDFLKDEKDVNALLEKAKIFAAKAYDYFNNPLWRNDPKAIKEIKRIKNEVHAIIPEYQLSEDVTTEEHKNRLWSGFQEVADSVCDAINKGELSLESILEKIREVNEQLNLSAGTKKSKQILKEYLRDGGRCVALMELDTEKVIAFSGFWDCEDQALKEKLGGKDDELEIFKMIAAACGAKLAYLSEQIVDHLQRYCLNEKFEFEEKGPLRKELGVPDKNIKRLYSCCERKILASPWVKAGALPKETILHIKFQPCYNCYGGLRKWVDDTGVVLTLDVPEE